MAVKYKLYLVHEDDTYSAEFYSKKDLESYKLEKSEDIDLFECAERMVNKFNRQKSKRGNKIIKRYAYKLEKVSVNVIGSFPYYGLNISNDMCKPEFK